MKFRNLVEINMDWLEDTRLIIICDRLVHSMNVYEALDKFGDRVVHVFHKYVVVLD